MSAYKKNLERVIIRPRVTEKSTALAERGVYCFEVDSRAGKAEIGQAVKKIYNVEPVKINITRKPAKTRGQRGRRGVKSGLKKAVVYLKKGDTITFV